MNRLVRARLREVGRVIVFAIAAVLCVLVGEPARAGADKAPVIAFVASSAEALAPVIEEFRLGFAAAEGGLCETRSFAFPPTAKLSELAAALKKAPPDVVVAWCEDGRTREMELLAEKAKLPLVVVSPEETRQTLDTLRAVFWAGGIRTPDEALQAMDFLLIPLSVHHPAILHDGSARGADAAARCLTLHHVSQDPIGPIEIAAATFDGAAAAKLLADGADGIVYFGGVAGANALLDAVEKGELKVPVLLGQGLANRGVPAFAEGRAKTAWALEPVVITDYDGIAKDAKPLLDAASLATKVPVTAAMLRGFRVGALVRDALVAAEGQPKLLNGAIRGLSYTAARGKAIFNETGHMNLQRFVPWRSPAEPNEPAFRWVRSTLMPMSAIPQVGTFQPSLFKWVPGSVHVHCSWGDAKDRTIEKDLKAIGLAVGGYEASLETQVIDDLMGRFISRMNRLYLRNPDGSAIPGVSYNISFTTDPPGKDVKGPKFQAILWGDDPDTGGVASGTVAHIFTTFIQRTLYAEHALKPPICAADRSYVVGKYRWGSSLDGNIRGDSIRALVDGYSQGLALTGAHEVGHVAGLGHDTESPRSLMNVVEAVGLDFDWAEWNPEHAKTLQRSLGRVPALKD